MALQVRPSVGRGHRVLGRRILAGMTAAALVASLAASPVAAGTSTITAPRIVYTGVNQTVDFSGLRRDLGREPRDLDGRVDLGHAATRLPATATRSAICGRVQISLNDVDWRHPRPGRHHRGEPRRLADGVRGDCARTHDPPAGGPFYHQHERHARPAQQRPGRPPVHPGHRLRGRHVRRGHAPRVRHAERSTSSSTTGP